MLIYKHLFTSITNLLVSTNGSHQGKGGLLRSQALSTCSFSKCCHIEQIYFFGFSLLLTSLIWTGILRMGTSILRAFFLRAATTLSFTFKTTGKMKEHLILSKQQIT